MAGLLAHAAETRKRVRCESGNRRSGVLRTRPVTFSCDAARLVQERDAIERVWDQDRRSRRVARGRLPHVWRRPIAPRAGLLPGWQGNVETAGPSGNEWPDVSDREPRARKRMADR